ncbi:MAG: type II secretion system F family protein [Acidimicrobiales bacterium]
MTAAVCALAAALGAHYLYTALVLRWPGVRLAPPGRRRPRRTGPRRLLEQWLAQAGLVGVAPGEFAGVCAALFVFGGSLGFALFGRPLAATVVGGFAASLPVAAHRSRRRRRARAAQEAWPRLIEEIRILTGGLGRSVPQALFEVGRRGPVELRPAFEAAHREWLISTDFARTITVLKTLLADPTADAACETLLIAHELGGKDLDGRLTALAEDRTLDVQGRRDAEAKQAGVRFARGFTLLMPAGMALAGAGIGQGRAAYTSGFGQALVLVALSMTAGCWWWAGRIMRLPPEQRVFDR